MSKTPETKSIAGPDCPSTASVYDFLYNDKTRVGSYLAQFESSGHLKELHQTDIVSGVTTSSASKEGGLGSHIVAKAGQSESTAEEERHEMRRVFDPLWSNALSLLDYLEDRQLLKRDIHASGIGQFVLLSGALKLLDLRLIQALWNQPKLAKRFGIGDPKVITKQQREANEIGLEIIKLVPHTVQAHVVEFRNEQFFSATWMNLDPANMTVSTGDILMKWGFLLTGEWHVLGIKDAAPDGGPQEDQELQRLMTLGWDHAAADRQSSVIALMAELLSPIARRVAGRAGFWYGLTPILIFRKISG